MAVKRETRDDWTDVLGQKYGPGDCVAYASISGKSPQLVIGEVVAIYTTNARGEPYVDSYYDYVEGKRVSEPSCSVSVMPLLDARGFWRSDKPRPVNLTLVNNIIKVPNELKPRPKAERDLERNVAGITDLLKDLAK